MKGQFMLWMILVGILAAQSFFIDKKVRLPGAQHLLSTSIHAQDDFSIVPKKGIIDYIGKTNIDDLDANFHFEAFDFKPANRWQRIWTRFKLWRQLPWRKIKGKIILKASLSGSLSVVPSSSSSLFSSGKPSLEEKVSSLYDLMNLFVYGAHDPRVMAVYLELGRLDCGYAKLAELRRYIAYFQKSGKKVIGFSNACSEKEFFLASALDDFYMSPEGNLDLRGLSASASFYRGVFDKIGIEPQVQRLGKYKSFGDTYNNTGISEAQREVTSSLLSEAAQYWVHVLSQTKNLTKAELYGLWSESANRDAFSFKQRGLLSGVLYKDQIEKILQFTHRTPQLSILNRWQYNASKDAEMYRNISVSKPDFNLTYHFEMIPRRFLDAANNTAKNSSSLDATSSPSFFSRLFPLKYSDPAFFPANSYLRKMRRAPRILPNLPVHEASYGPRIAVINCVGAIQDGESDGRSVGSDSVIAQIRKARDDRNVCAVVVRVDSPGGSALASDLVWRELRMLCEDKPVVANMVDVAASGGYYFAMACDQIVADQLTVTGSIGVVTAKFNAQELTKRIGLNTETISIGKYAEFFSVSRGFRPDEQQLFEEFAQRAYQSFVTKAAASRNMSYESMHAVAQGRVWTGKQAFDRGLVDILGGFWKALDVAAKLSNYYPAKMPTGRVVPLRIQTYANTPTGLASLLRGGLQAKQRSSRSALHSSVLTMCADEVAWTGLAASESLGISSDLQRLGLSPALAHVLRQELPAETESLLSTISAVDDRQKVGLMGLLSAFFERLS